MVLKGRSNVNEASGAAHEQRQRWIYGIHSVTRRLQVVPASVREVRLALRDNVRLAGIEALARRAGIRVHPGDGALLRRLTGSANHQGVAALTGPFDYADLDDLLGRGIASALVLDRIQDPHNLGALIRSAAAAGAGCVVIPRHGAAEVSPAVEKVAAGTVNDVPVCAVTNVSRTLERLRERGFWAVALVAGAARSVFDLEVPGRIALVLGGEQGIRPLVRRSCDLEASIPMAPGVESLNASVAGAVAMFELLCRRRRPA